MQSVSIKNKCCKMMMMGDSTPAVLGVGATAPPLAIVGCCSVGWNGFSDVSTPG